MSQTNYQDGEIKLNTLFILNELLIRWKNIVHFMAINVLQLFMGNIDNSELISRNYFPEPVMARFVKFYPQKWITSIALRVELYGCPAGNNYKNYSCSFAGLSLCLIHL